VLRRGVRSVRPAVFAAMGFMLAACAGTLFSGRAPRIVQLDDYRLDGTPEGRILDGCVTCPWHGYQYLPDTGASPPPFTEKVPTYRTQVIDGRVLVHPCAHAPGTRIEPARIDGAVRTRA